MAEPLRRVVQLQVRDELLTIELFSCLAEAKVMVADWREDYG